jgi:heme/copper-type cytochrome/quinol oxidase subunit 2
MVAAIRPDSWNWLLFFHLLFAFLLVGGTIAVVIVSIAAGRERSTHAPLLRATAFRTNLLVVLPSLIGAYVLGEVLAGKEFDSGEPDWLELGRILTSAAVVVGGVLVTLLQYRVLRKARSGQTGGRPAQLAAALPVAVLATVVTVIVLMAGKPGG